MDTQDENKLHKFDQEVDTVVRKSKRKRSEGQLKALAEGRTKRREKKNQDKCYECYWLRNPFR